MRFLYWFIPVEWLSFVIVGLLIGLIVGLVKPRTVLIIGAFILFLPALEASLGTLPIWVQWTVSGLLVLAFLRDLLAFFLGNRAADQAVGEFVSYILRLLFQMFLIPFRMAGWILRTTLHQ